MAAEPWRESRWHKGRLLFQPSQLDGNAPWRGIFRAVTRLVTLQEPTYVWRGQEDLTWPLTPSLHRKVGAAVPEGPVRAKRLQTEVSVEVERLMLRARAHGHDRVDGRDLRSLGLLALLQHNGAATPLLDVTTDPIVALYFASLPAPRLDPHGSDKDGVVLAIDTRRATALRVDIDSDATFTDIVARLDTEGFGFAVYTPPSVSPRITAQRGRFIFGRVTPGVAYSTLAVPTHEEWSSNALKTLLNPDGGGRPMIPPVVGIRVAASEKPRVREVLRKTYGLDAESLFPDLAGFARAHDVGGLPLTANP
jgi:hypothetical protein